VGIILPKERKAEWASGADIYFFCGQTLADGVLVCWAGDGNQGIVLHPRCAERLGAYLIADSREADLAGGRHPLNRRSEQLFLSTITGERR